MLCFLSYSNIQKLITAPIRIDSDTQHLFRRNHIRCGPMHDADCIIEGSIGICLLYVQRSQIMISHRVTWMDR